MESFCIRSAGNSGSVFLSVSCNIPCWLVVRSWEDSVLAVLFSVGDYCLIIVSTCYGYARNLSMLRGSAR